MKAGLIVLLVITSVTQNCLAGKRYEKGDTLYVWAKDGINVRSTPVGQVVAKIPFGNPVIVQQVDEQSDKAIEVIPPVRSTNIQSPGVSIYGQYVVVSFNNSNGYVFDAYLSKFPPIRCANGGYECEDFDRYFSREFGILKVWKNDTLNHEVKHVRIVYNNGVTYELNTAICCGQETIIIPDMEITEAYVLLNRILHFESDFKNEAESKSGAFKVLKNTDSGTAYIREQCIELGMQ